MALALILDNLRWGLRLARGQITTNSGTVHSALSLQDSIRYIDQVFDDYKEYGAITGFSGRAAEIGPGDSAGVALRMRYDGCDQVDLIDRFSSRHDPRHQASIYRELAHREGTPLHDSPAPASSVSEPSPPDSSCTRQELPGIRWHGGEAAETYFARASRNGAPRYDFIVSRAVMQDLYDPLGALRDMIRCLNPQGVMLHKIDLRDLGLFSRRSHELTWLRFPHWLHRWMTCYSGRPNRILVHHYRDALEPFQRAGELKYQILVTRLVSVGDISPHRLWAELPVELRTKATTFVESKRSEFAPGFKRVAAEDLAVSGIFLVVRRT